MLNRLKYSAVPQRGRRRGDDDIGGGGGAAATGSDAGCAGTSEDL